jgi:hypothetical protein
MDEPVSIGVGLPLRRSTPEQKYRPVARTSITFSSGVSRKWCSACSNNSIACAVSAFSLSGRFSVAIRIAPCSSIKRWGVSVMAFSQ